MTYECVKWSAFIVRESAEYLESAGKRKHEETVVKCQRKFLNSYIVGGV